jgi:hypothetical protein
MPATNAMTDPTLTTALHKHLNTVPFGSVTLTINRHQGKTTNVQVSESENQKFTDSKQFLSWLTQGLGVIGETKRSGVLQFILTVKDGQVTKMTETRRLDLSVAQTGKDAGLRGLGS